MRVSEPASAGVGGPLVRKPTRWASSAPEVLRRVGLQRANEGQQPSDPRWREHPVSYTHLTLPTICSV
eukprot:7248844-Alexandrium_andersonii.AAC.1